MISLSFTYLQFIWLFQDQDYSVGLQLNLCQQMPNTFGFFSFMAWRVLLAVSGILTAQIHFKATRFCDALDEGIVLATLALTQNRQVPPLGFTSNSPTKYTFWGQWLWLSWQSGSRCPWFESSHWQKYILNIFTVNCIENMKVKKKVADFRTPGPLITLLVYGPNLYLWGQIDLTTDTSRKNQITWAPPIYCF